jgi:hypothetical protein
MDFKYELPGLKENEIFHSSHQIAEVLTVCNNFIIQDKRKLNLAENILRTQAT